MSSVPIRELFAFGRSARDSLPPAVLENYPDHDRHGYCARRAALDNAREHRRCRNQILVDAGVAIYEPKPSYRTNCAESLHSMSPALSSGYLRRGNLARKLISCTSLGLGIASRTWVDNLLMRIIVFPKIATQPATALIKHHMKSQGAKRFFLAGLGTNILWHLMMYGPYDSHSFVCLVDRFVLALVSKRAHRKRYIVIRKWMLAGSELVFSFVLYASRLWYFQQALGLASSLAPFPGFRTLCRYPFYIIGCLSAPMSLSLNTSSTLVSFFLFYVLYGLPTVHYSGLVRSVESFLLSLLSTKGQKQSNVFGAYTPTFNSLASLTSKLLCWVTSEDTVSQTKPPFTQNLTTGSSSARALVGPHEESNSNSGSNQTHTPALRVTDGSVVETGASLESLTFYPDSQQRPLIPHYTTNRLDFLGTSNSGRSVQYLNGFSRPVVRSSRPTISPTFAPTRTRSRLPSPDALVSCEVLVDDQGFVSSRRPGSQTNTLAVIAVSGLLALASIPVEYYVFRTVTRTVIASLNQGNIPPAILQRIAPVSRWMAVYKTLSKVLLCYSIGLGCQLVTSTTVWKLAKLLPPKDGRSSMF